MMSCSPGIKFINKASNSSILKILMYLIPDEHDIIVIYRRHFNKMLSIMDALWAKKHKLVGLVDPYNSYVRDPRVGTPFPQVIERI